MFDKNEIEMWLQVGKIAVVEAHILKQVEDNEPDLMGYWVYRKRIRAVPDDISMAAHFRFSELKDKAGISGKMTKHIFENVCDAIWNKLSDEERQRLMRSI
jgi:hypothetical protein